MVVQKGSLFSLHHNMRLWTTCT